MIPPSSFVNKVMDHLPLGSKRSDKISHSIKPKGIKEEDTRTIVKVTAVIALPWIQSLADMSKRK